MANALAPNTFLIPISLVRFSAESVAKPKRPIQEIKMISMAEKLIICFHLASFSYCFWLLWSLKSALANPVKSLRTE